MSARTPDLTVIMVTHQGRDLALATLRSARAHAGELEAEWLVVDSGSSDGTPGAIEREFPDVPVTRCPNIGFAAANNVALERARGRYVLLLNPDMEVVRGSLASLVAALDARPRVGAASIVQQWPDGRLQPTIRRFPSPARQLGEAMFAARWPGLHRLQEPDERPQAYRRESPADWLVGGFLLVRRAAIDSAGYLDERFFLFSEETDWCYRLRRAGWEVRHLPNMTVTHHTGRSQRPDLFAQNSHSKLLYAEKHFSPPRRAAFRAALTARHALRLALLGPVALLRPAVRTRLRAERLALLVVLGVVEPPFRPLAGP